MSEEDIRKFKEIEGVSFRRARKDASVENLRRICGKVRVTAPFRAADLLEEEGSHDGSEGHGTPVCE